jgi:hypothetical protein
MDHAHHAHHSATSLNRTAWSATLHCPVNRWLLSRGKGHAVVHAHHH